MSQTETVSKSVLNNQKHNAEFEKQREEEREAKDQKQTGNQEPKPIVGTDTTKKILSKYGVDNVVTQDELDEREQNSDSTTDHSVEENTAVNENEQVDEVTDEVSDITEADLEVLENAGIEESDLEGKTFKEIKDMANGLNKEQVTKSDTQDQNEIVISDEYAETLAVQYPFAKNLKGKTMSEVMKIISDQNSYISQLEQKGKDSKQDVDKTEENNSQNSETADIVTEDDVIKLFDPLRDPKDVAKELSALLTKAKGQGASNEQIKEAIKKELPDLDGLQQANAEKIREQFHNELSGQLPEGSDAKQVFTDWKKANIKMPVEQKKALLENPSLLIDKVASDYKLKKFETKIVEDEKSKNNEIKKTTYVKLRKLLKDSKKLGSGAKFNFERKHSKSTNLGDQDGTEAEKMTGRIIQKWIDKA